MDYPIWEIAIGGPLLMAIVAITHVIVSHFAIGGGLVIAVTETLAVRRGDQALRDLAKRSSLVLILVSTVFGAISGVGIWVVAGLITPTTISTLIRNYVWGWAIEWVFFIVELVAALIYFATWDKIAKRTHVMIGWVYFIAAYLSLVIINGIITFMLTPGTWLQTRAFWDGFFNPTYFSSLTLRTGIAMIMATAFMIFAARRAASADRSRLMRYLGIWLVAGVILSYAGYRWWESDLPEAVRGLFLGASPALSALASTRQFLLWALTATLGLGFLFLIVAPRAARAIPLVLVMLAGFAFFAGYERLREGVRKPYLIHDYMFSNGIRVDEISRLNEEGILSKAQWAAFPPSDELHQKGRAVFRAQCMSCHTLDGYQGIRGLASDDVDMNLGVLYVMQDQGHTMAGLPPGESLDKSEFAYPFMPPFVGTEEEMQALATYLAGVVGGETAQAAAQDSQADGLAQESPRAASSSSSGGAR
jgi:mono/diheme cytochrome c family protein